MAARQKNTRLSYDQITQHMNELLDMARRQHTALNCLRASGLPEPLANIVNSALGEPNHG